MFQEVEVPLEQYLTFLLGSETYAIAVNHTREVVEYTETTSVPNAPDWVRGIINLRGAVIPVLDIRQKFGMPSTECDANTRIIILEFDVNGEALLLGILADTVKDVIETESKQIEPAPAFGGSISSKYVRGIGRSGDAYFVVLDIEKVFSGHELSVASNAVAG